MSTPKVFESEYRFCLILWRSEPATCAELARVCGEELGWSRTTTYTVIRRLTERGIVRNKDSVVSSLVSKEEIQLAEMNEMMTKTFENSLPAFLAAFAKQQDLSEEDIAQIRHIIGE